LGTIRVAQSLNLLAKPVIFIYSEFRNQKIVEILEFLFIDSDLLPTRGV